MQLTINNGDQVILEIDSNDLYAHMIAATAKYEGTRAKNAKALKSGMDAPDTTKDDILDLTATEQVLAILVTSSSACTKAIVDMNKENQ